MRTIRPEVAARLLLTLDNKLQTIPKGIVKLSSADKENLSAAKGLVYFQVNGRFAFDWQNFYCSCARGFFRKSRVRQHAFCKL